MTQNEMRFSKNVSAMVRVSIYKKIVQFTCLKDKKTSIILSGSMSLSRMVNVVQDILELLKNIVIFLAQIAMKRFRIFFFHLRNWFKKLGIVWFQVAHNPIQSQFYSHVLCIGGCPQEK